MKCVNQAAISLHKLNVQTENGNYFSYTQQNVHFQKSFSNLSAANTEWPSNFISVSSSVFTSGLIGSYWHGGSRALNTVGRNANDLPGANGPCCNETGKILTDYLHTSHCSHFRHTNFSLSPFISPWPWPGIMNEAVTYGRRCGAFNTLLVTIILALEGNRCTLLKCMCTVSVLV